MSTLFCDHIDQYLLLGIPKHIALQYIGARCFTAEAAKLAWDAGLSADDLSCRPQADAETFGYMLANNDITTEKIVAELRRIYE